MNVRKEGSELFCFVAMPFRPELNYFTSTSKTTLRQSMAYKSNVAIIAFSHEH
jgi:hypothetical protein